MQQKVSNINRIAYSCYYNTLIIFNNIYLLYLVKYKFTNKEMLEIYEKVNQESTKKPDYALFVDDVCNENKRINLQIQSRSRLVI